MHLQRSTAIHTGCCSQWFFIVGRSFFMTTSSCMSSSVGCDPASSSNGSWYSSAGWSEHEFRLSSSQRTSPQAYMSIRRKASFLKLMAPSNISGAMYRRVPTLKWLNSYYHIHSHTIGLTQYFDFFNNQLISSSYIIYIYW